MSTREVHDRSAPRWPLLSLFLALAVGATWILFRSPTDDAGYALPPPDLVEPAGGVGVPPPSAVAAAADDVASSAERTDVESAPETADAPPDQRAPSPSLSTIVGRVVDPNGAPVEGVQVDARVTLFPIVRSTLRCETDAEGVFRFADVAPGRAVLSFSDDEFCAIDYAPIELEPDQVSDLGDVRMSRGTKVRGFVRVDGQRAAYMQVWIVPERRGYERGVSAQAITDANGDFVLSQKLAPGRYRTLVLGPSGLHSLPGLASAGRPIPILDFDLIEGQAEHTVAVDVFRRD